MRPTGDIRRALAAVAPAAGSGGGATWRELAEQAQVGYLCARRTVENMERAGALVVVGADKRAHSRRWMKLYVVPRVAAGSNWAAQGTDDGLAGAMRRWACSL